MARRDWNTAITPSGTTVTPTLLRSVGDNVAAAVAGVVTGTGTIKSSDVVTIHGKIVIEMANTAGAGIVTRYPYPSAGMAKEDKIYWYIAAAPPNAVVLGHGRHSSGQVWRFGVNTAAKIVVYDSTGGVLGTSTGTLTYGQWIRWETVVNVTNGTITIRAYVGDTTTVMAFVTLTGLALGSNALTHFEYGTPNNTAGAFTHYWADPAMTEGTGTEIGPTANAAPVFGAISANQDAAASTVVNLNFPATDTDSTFTRATTMLYPTGGTAPAISNGATQNPSFTTGSGTGNLYQIQHTLTDNADTSVVVTAVVEVYVPLGGTAEIKPLVGAGEGDTSWSNVGGAATRGAALADTDPATYIESNTVTATAQTRSLRQQPSVDRDTLTFYESVSQDVAGTFAGKLVLRSGPAKTFRQQWNLPTTTTVTEVACPVDASVIADLKAAGHFRSLWLDYVAVT